MIFKSYFTLTTIWAFFFLCLPIHCRSVELDLPLTHSKGMNNRCFEFSHRKWNTIATTLSLLQICFKHYILYCRQRPTPENITKLMLTYDQGTIQWRVSEELMRLFDVTQNLDHSTCSDWIYIFLMKHWNSIPWVKIDLFPWQTVVPCCVVCPGF